MLKRIAAIGSRFFNMGHGRVIERGPKYALSPAQIPETRWKNNNVFKRNKHSESIVAFLNIKVDHETVSKLFLDIFPRILQRSNETRSSLGPRNMQ